MVPIVIDQNGQWSWNGRPMVQERILSELKLSLHRDSQGAYWVTLDGKSVSVLVEDAPYTLVRLYAGPPASYLLDDGTTGTIPTPLELLEGDAHRLYMNVKNGEHQASFSRCAHQQIWERLDPTGAFLRLGETNVPIRLLKR